MKPSAANRARGRWSSIRSLAAAPSRWKPCAWGRCLRQRPESRPVLLNKVVLEYIPKYGQKLADEVRKWGEWIKEEAEKELAEFYPEGHGRRDADRLSVGADDPVRGPRLRGRGAADPFTLVGEESQPVRGAETCASSACQAGGLRGCPEHQCLKCR